MHILHISDAFAPRRGGIETQVAGLAQRQAAAGHRVEVLTCTAPQASLWRAWVARAMPAPDEAPMVPAGGVGTPIQVLRGGIPWPRIPASSAAVTEVLTTRAPDVVHAHLSVLSPLALLGVRAAVRSGVPVVVTMHSLWWWATGLYRIADRVNHWGGWPVRWTAVSDLAARPLHRVIGHRAEIAVLPNGIDAEAWRIDRAQDDDTVTVVSVMRFALRKRPRALLDIVQDVHRRLPEGIRLRVVVIGDGSQRGRMERRIRRAGLTGVVELVGPQTPEQIRRHYRTADVYLAPARLESFGIAALEARCAGLPVVALRHTGIAGFIHDGVNGLLAEDDDGLADAVLRLADSAPLRAEMARHNALPLTGVSWPEVMSACLHSYELAIKAAENR